MAPNDLVVLVASATARGHKRVTSVACGHFGYLAQPEPVRVIQDVLDVPARRPPVDID
jgi:hypothetical protein